MERVTTVGDSNLRSLIETVSNRFEEEMNIKVTPEARMALFLPAAPHLADVNADLASGKVSVPILEQSVWTILVNATEIAEDEYVKEIGAAAVKHSIDFDCTYFFWC